jgi:DNA-binding NarL/FixJ family response regulator
MFYMTQSFRERRDGPQKSIRVVAADDSPVALAAICSFLESLSSITIVGTALSGYELLQKAENL